MKYRSDFVTNSSSASYCVSFHLEGDGGAEVDFEVTCRDLQIDYDDSERYLGDIKDHLYAQSLSFDGLPSGPLPPDADLGTVTRLLMERGCVQYDDDVDDRQLRFFIVGEPQRYADRAELEEAVGRMGEVVTWPPDADFVIYCNKSQANQQLPQVHQVWDERLQDWFYPRLSDEERDKARTVMSTVARDIHQAIQAAGVQLMCPDEEYEGGWNDWRFSLDGLRQQGPWDAVWRLSTLIDSEPYTWNPSIISEEELSYFEHEPQAYESFNAIPGAPYAFRARCEERGITRENLRLVKVHAHSRAFGESRWEVDDRDDDWYWDVSTSAVEAAHDVLRRAGE